MSIIMLPNFLTRFFNWLKEVYKRQPELISVRPIGFKNPIRKISLTAVVLDSDNRARTISTIGDSKGVTFKPEWIKLLSPPFRLHLIQTDKKAVLVEEIEGGDSNE